MTVTCAGGRSYAVSRSDRTLVVDKAALELKADNKSKVYGQDNPALTFSVDGLTNGDTKATALTADPVLDTAAVKSSNAGSYAITVTGGTSSNRTQARRVGNQGGDKAAPEQKADNTS